MMKKLKAGTDSLTTLKLHAVGVVLACGLGFSSNSDPRNLFPISNVTASSGGSSLEQDSAPDQLPRAIFKRWVHSHEEDTEEVKVFRPANYRFPRSRGRSGFEIREDGTFLLYAIAPTDGLRTIRGTWKLTGPQTVVASFDDERIVSYSMKIISSSEDVLKTSSGGQGPRLSQF